MLGAHLAFVNAQAEAAVWIVAHPDFERDVATVWSIVREWDEHSLTALPAGWPFFFRHTKTRMRAQSFIRKPSPKDKGD